MVGSTTITKVRPNKSLLQQLLEKNYFMTGHMPDFFLTDRRQQQIVLKNIEEGPKFKS
jgi:hypothetical protein